MLNRKLLKAEARKTFKANYWYSVLVSFVSLLIVGSSSASSTRKSSEDVSSNLDLSVFNTMNVETTIVLIVLVLTIVVMAILLSSTFNAFIYNPYRAGLKSFFLKNHDDIKPTFKDTFYFFKGGNYLNCVITLFLKNLFITLWSLLFVIPGIIKSLEYSQVEYILLDNPGIKWKDALRKSKEMTKGYKWSIFILDLSFIGWQILALIPFVGPLYVNPYINQTDAEVYLVLKDYYVEL